MRTGSITLETTASGISEHRPRKQTCKASAATQRQLLGFFDRQFFSVWDRSAAGRPMDDQINDFRRGECVFIFWRLGEKQHTIVG